MVLQHLELKEQCGVDLIRSNTPTEFKSA